MDDRSAIHQQGGAALNDRNARENFRSRGSGPLNQAGGSVAKKTTLCKNLNRRNGPRRPDVLKGFVRAWEARSGRGEPDQKTANNRSKGVLELLGIVSSDNNTEFFAAKMRLLVLLLLSMLMGMFRVLAIGMFRGVIMGIFRNDIMGILEFIVIGIFRIMGNLGRTVFLAVVSHVE